MGHGRLAALPAAPSRGCREPLGCCWGAPAPRVGWEKHRRAPQIASVRAPSPAGCPGRDGAGLMVAACARSSSPSSGEMSLAKGRAGGGAEHIAHPNSPGGAGGWRIAWRLRGLVQHRLTGEGLKKGARREVQSCQEDEALISRCPQSPGSGGCPPTSGCSGCALRGRVRCRGSSPRCCWRYHKGCRGPGFPLPSLLPHRLCWGLFFGAEAPLESLPEPVPLPITTRARGDGVAAPLGGSGPSLAAAAAPLSGPCRR